MNTNDEIHHAMGRPHLRDHAQILKPPGVLLPSDITPTYDSLDVTKPAVAAEVVLTQLQQWGIEPAAVASGLVQRLAGDPEPLIAAKAREVITAIDQVAEREQGQSP